AELLVGAAQLREAVVVTDQRAAGDALDAEGGEVVAGAVVGQVQRRLLATQPRAEALVVAVNDVAPGVDDVDGVVRPGGAGEAVRRAEQHPQAQLAGGGLDVARGGGQLVPVDGVGAGDVHAGVAGQGRLAEVGDVGAGRGRLTHLPQDPAAVVGDGRLDRELAGGDAKASHGTVTSSR